MCQFFKNWKRIKEKQVTVGAHKCLRASPCSFPWSYKQLRHITINSTREVLVYFLYIKFDAFATFKRWKAEVEKEVDLMIKCLRSDNGG